MSTLPKARGLRVLPASFCALVGGGLTGAAFVVRVRMLIAMIPIEGGDWGGSALFAAFWPSTSPPQCPPSTPLYSTPLVLG